MPAILARLVPALLLAAVIIGIYYGPSKVKEAVSVQASKADNTRVLFVIIIVAALLIGFAVNYLVG